MIMLGALIRRSLVTGVVAIGLACAAAPAAAQTGQVKGKVVDKDNNIIVGATISIENLDGAGQKLTTKTDKRGTYIQIGLAPGNYRITAEKGDLKQVQNTKIGLDMTELDFKLVPGTGGPMTKEEQQKKIAAMQAAFSDAVALTNSGKDDEAIAKFQEVLQQAPKCAECYSNIGTIYGRMKQYDKAEAAFKQAIEIKPDLAQAYSGLASVYNAEKKFDEAAAASQKASDLNSAAGTAAGTPAAGADAASVFNQGVIFWNAKKIPEAKEKFQEALKIDPNLAEAHYWLGMALINEGKVDDAKPEFQQYLKLDPNGRYAATAKTIIGGH